MIIETQHSSDTRRKRLLLAYPNMRWHKDDSVTLWNLDPTTLCLLAAVVKDLVEVKVLDAQFHNMDQEAFKAEIAAFAPDYVGLSLLTSEYEQALYRAARLVKEVDHAITVIAGGVHVTTMPEHVLECCPSIDYCVVGEGEHVLRELLLHLQGRGPLPEKGLAFGHDKLVVQQQAMVDDLSVLPWPDYELVDYAAYIEKPQRSFTSNMPPAYPYVRMVTTRGCPFGCTFCQVETIAGRRVRTRDPVDVVDQLFFLKERYGIGSIVFDEDNILLGENDYARRLFQEMIDRKLELKWIASAFALFLITDELLELMKESGCVGINVAIESGNERVLKEIVNKPIKNLAAIPEIIAKVQAKGIYCIANFIIGFPGETWDEIRETVAFAERCGADYVKIYAAVPLYKTKLYYLAKEQGLLVCNEAIPKVDWRYGQITSKEWTTKDVSILRAYEWDRINFAPHKIERLLEITGATEDELKTVRKNTRDNLVW
ncbi:radical SAM domain iron-sulfur cluster-binding oxidoreductase with cobamide-binding-like domain [Geotalea daltonii FRC-32]|uniref:Radical SAM domain iron-sulfur cluster-binding oxidoreductase with cobamide-binding-like domain n=1 Tax=Geotalea daltonii (strain DSM 22248 / JCM 15807 / FRC-32) TaxID=316067 RepID=B9M0I7_GEODF|nr:radical SAM protein [Geotalea daltonii]ACM19024.1 radical SAM domain iron-sulfur cluster-binding oxidoreductase with cobamide-binding-like domain [Geotalea daltonii FRC-32]